MPMLALPPLAFSRPDFLFLLALLPLFWLWQRRAFRTLLSFLSLFLHSLTLALLVLAAAGLHRLRPGAESTPLLAIDLSHSLTPVQRQWMHDTIVQRLRPAPDTPTLVFAGQRRRLSWQEAEPLLAAPPAELQLDETNLAGALTGLLGEARHRSVYLLSDGWETEEDARTLLPLLAERGLTLYPFPPPPAEAAPNVAIQRLGAPQSTAGGETIEVSAALENTNPHPVRGELTLRQSDKVVWRQEVTLPPGVSRLTHSLSLSDSGLIPLHATFTPAVAQEDAIAQDNQATAWVSVAPMEKVLLLSARAQDNRYLEKALSNRGLGVTAIDFAARPATVPSPEPFGAVILNNVASDKLPPAMLSSLDDYVSKGGGLVMVGGEESLGLGGYKGTPVEKALPVTLTPPQKEERHTAMMLVIDKSGSMRKENKLLYAKEGARAVARNLKDTDLLGIVGFDQESFVVVPLEYLGKIRNDIDDRLDRLKASGGTFLLPALQEAKRQLERQYATRKQIVILTDGETGGSGSDYLDLVTVMHNELKITLSAIAVGEQANLRLLSRLAEYGGGAFHHTTDPSTLPDLFLDEMEDKGEEKTMVEKELLPIPSRDSPLLKGLDDRPLPPVRGYVEAEVKKGARLDLALRADGKRPPLLASWSYGQGKAVAFTSDANGRWSAPWVSWEGFSKFWSQVVRWCLPEVKRKESHFAVELGHNETGLLVDLFSYGTSEEGRAASARVSGPATSDGSFPLERLAPGHYQGVYATTRAGD
ncbi:MAG: VWA domain-containing protein, partial [Deltaproteobacteria bacterium]|nr:VWA domain-containing protein [Deltaproteobacteria bacterium]